MKKILIIIAFYLLNTFAVLADKNDCSEMKKLSKEYIGCKAKNIKQDSTKKTEQIKEGVKKIFNNVNNKIKKKE